MAEKLVGYYKLVSTENGDAFMKAIDIGYLTRKGASLVTIYVEIVKEGDDWQLNYLSTFKNQKTSFKLGETFPYKTADGRSFTVCFVEADGKIVQTETMDASKSIPSVYTWELEDDNTLLVTAKTTVDGKKISMIRRFSRQQK